MWSFFERHWEVLKAAWAQETERRKTAVKRAEADFLPAALEVMERPPSPLGRAILWTVLAFFLIAVIWAIFGRVDVVASAAGRTILKDRAKVIQAAEIGVVRAIHVEDGQSVKAGDPLIELDPTITDADAEQARQRLGMARIDTARGHAMLNYLEGKPHVFEAPPGEEPSIAQRQEQLIAARIQEFEARVETVEKQLEEANASGRVARQQVKKLSETLPLLHEQVRAQEQLEAKGLTPRLQVLEIKERYVTLRQDLAISKEEQAKAEASVAAFERQREQVRQEFRREIISELADAERNGVMAEQELNKAAGRRGLQTLAAPVDGTVQQLSVHTIGGVVQPAETLLIVVPGEGEIWVEASVLNKDIGFVNVGDPVEVKLEAFPFTKYGIIHGALETLSTDAVQTEDRGLIYAARVRLDRQTIEVRGKEVALAPGMQAVAEVKTGKRRLIEYLMSPLLRYRDEAFRER